MHKLNSTNITDYINFLHKKKNGVNAPTALLERWAQIPEYEIYERLDHLYEHWNYTLVQRGELMQEYTNIKNTLNITSNYSLPSSKATSQAVVKKTPTNVKQKVKSSLTKLLYFGIAIGLGFVSYKYLHFKNLKPLYTLTERVAVRNEYGEQIASLDLNASGSADSYTSLLALDNTIYNRAIDSSGKLFEHRKVVMQTDNFYNFLTEDPNIFAYVNANYVIDNKQEYENYKRLFGQVRSEDNKILQLKHRKIIAESMQRSNALKNLYIISSCNNAKFPKTDKGILIAEIVTGAKYQIIAKLSDGYYYSFIGDNNSKIYELPKRIGYQNNPSRDIEYLTGNILFRYNKADRKFYLTDCLGKNLFISSNNNSVNEISHFSKPIPSQSLPEPITELTEKATDVIEDIKNIAEKIFE